MSRIKRKKMEAVELPRKVVEATAHIIGPNSAAAKALQRAEEIGQSARFWNVGSAIVVTSGDLP